MPDHHLTLRISRSGHAGLRLQSAVLLALTLLLTGCAAYRAPGGGAGLASLLRPDTAARPQRQPEAPFPAHLALVRIQAADYATNNNACVGTGRYCVMTVRDNESDGDRRRLARLPLVAGLVNIPRMVLPERFDSVDDLRQAAAKLHVDLLLLYTVDTRFTINHEQLDPLAVIKPGFLPDKDARVTATTVASLIDVRSGFEYAKVEATSWRDRNAAVWATRRAIGDDRRIAERASFELMLDRFEQVWHKVVAKYGMRNG